MHSHNAEGSKLSVQSEIFRNLSLHLDDVEFLRNAFLVQAITAPLVRFSNRGRYEPYAAKSWSQEGTSWLFTLYENLKCEDGELISANSFKLSLERSIRSFSAADLKETPFYNLKEIRTAENILILDFNKTVGKAVLEYLAMTPFSFLCSSNFDGEKWKTNNQFISSGPYKVSDFRPDQDFAILELRKDWPLSPKGAFQFVRLGQNEDPAWNADTNLEMTYSLAKGRDEKAKLVYEVPRALISVRLGIENNMFFKNRDNRTALKIAIDQVADETPIPFENYHRANSFFFGQTTGHELPSKVPLNVVAPSAPLQIRGFTGRSQTDEFYFEILRKALDKLGWAHESMSTTVTSAKDFYKQNYDIAFDRSHVDATLDPDFVRILFKSKLGPRYQDPGGRISQLVDLFDAGKMPYRDFLISFNSILAEEAAVIPLFHRGLTFKFSPNVDVTSICPLMSIIRYEELKVSPRNIQIGPA